ncbi:MAG: PhoH family protein [Candidatus Nucleicultricaceae bacterium]
MSENAEVSLEIEFENNKLLPLLFGERDRFLRHIEKTLGVTIVARGNHVLISGVMHNSAAAHTALSYLYERLQAGREISSNEVDAAIRLASGRLDDPNRTPDLNSDALDVVIPTRRRVISARSPNQAHYLKLLKENDLVFALGPAGTGKTYLAVATAVSMLFAGQVNRIILSRPAVEAGERLGFLPGDLREKVDPYLRPLYDALFDMIPSEQVAKRFQNGEIEVAPLAFMRGRTLAKSFVILDEAQNTTTAQMKMFLTRLGEGSRMAVTGDLTQVDLPSGVYSGLREAVNLLHNVDGVAIKHFDKKDIVRHPLVSRIVDAYEKGEAKHSYGKDKTSETI